MRTATLVKEIVGKELEEKGFEYVKQRKRSEVWCYRREKDRWFQWFFIVHSRSNKAIWLEIALSRRKDDNPLTGFGKRYFKKEKTTLEGKEYYFEEATFKRALGCLRQQIEEIFLPGFAKIADLEFKWEITPEMQKQVYDDWEELADAIRDFYGISSMNEGELLLFTAEIIEAYREATLDEFKEELMELAALWIDCILSNLEGYNCVWEKDAQMCRLDYRMVTINPELESRFKFMRKEALLYSCSYPLNVLNEVWQKKDMKGIYLWYDTLFAERRKERKAVSYREDLQSEMMEKGNEKEHGIVKAVLMPFMEEHGYRYDFYQNSQKGYLCYRGKEADRQEMWLKRNEQTGEMWVSVITRSGRELQLPDIEEGLGTYDGTEYCERFLEWNYRRFKELIAKMMDQMEQIFMPALENEEKYLLKWELTHEMRRREFFERKKLAEKVKETYGEDHFLSKDLPAFIKKILQENEDKTMEEFGDILLGLGVMLGEAAISEIEGSHWLWDRERSKCIIAYGNEVAGIDPAFALNYAWQKKKPENVDRLYEILMRGLYIERKGE